MRFSSPLLFAFLISMGSGCESLRELSNPTGIQTQADGSGSGSVEYLVRGTASAASMTYATGGGGTSQTGDRTLPWSVTTTGFVSGQFVYISAQNGGSTGCVTVEIRKRGNSYKTEQSCGAYVIASASGTY